MVSGEPAGEGGNILLRERIARAQGAEGYPGKLGTTRPADGWLQCVPVLGQ